MGSPGRPQVRQQRYDLRPVRPVRAGYQASAVVPWLRGRGRLLLRLTVQQRQERGAELEPHLQPARDQRGAHRIHPDAYRALLERPGHKRGAVSWVSGRQLRAGPGRAAADQHFGREHHRRARVAAVGRVLERVDAH